MTTNPGGEVSWYGAHFENLVYQWTSRPLLNPFYQLLMCTVNRSLHVPIFWKVMHYCIEKKWQCCLVDVSDYQIIARVCIAFDAAAAACSRNFN